MISEEAGEGQGCSALDYGLWSRGLFCRDCRERLRQTRQNSIPQYAGLRTRCAYSLSAITTSRPASQPIQGSVDKIEARGTKRSGKEGKSDEGWELCRCATVLALRSASPNLRSTTARRATSDELLDNFLLTRFLILERFDVRTAHKDEIVLRHLLTRAENYTVGDFAVEIDSAIRRRSTHHR